MVTILLFGMQDNNAYPQWLCADLGLPCDVRNIKQTFVEKDVCPLLLKGQMIIKNGTYWQTVVRVLPVLECNVKELKVYTWYTN